MPSADRPTDRRRVVPRPVLRNRAVILRIGAVLAGAGLITAVIGTFLPWLVSGGVLRNSYAIAGIVHRLGLVENPVGAAILSSWPLFPPVATVAFVAGILAWWRTAAVITAVFGLPAALIGAGALVVAGGGGGGSAGIGVAYSGPLTTLVGGGSALAGATVVLIGSRRRGPAVGRVTGHPAGGHTGFSDHLSVSTEGGSCSLPSGQPRRPSDSRFEPMIQIRDPR